MLRGRERRYARERLSKQNESKERTDGRREPERLGLVMDRTLDLGGSLVLGIERRRLVREFPSGTREGPRRRAGAEQ